MVGAIGVEGLGSLPDREGERRGLTSRCGADSGSVGMTLLIVFTCGAYLPVSVRSDASGVV